MTIDLAKKILLKEFNLVASSQEFDELEIDFMGGETLMAFPLIKAIVEWLIEAYRPCPFICSATTNGTLLTSDIKKWAIDHRKYFKLLLSYDGTPAVQNYNRSNSATKIDLTFFQKFFGDQDIKMTVHPDTVHRLAEGVRYLHNQGLTVNPSFAYGIRWQPVKVLIYKQQLIEIAKFLLEHPQYKVIHSLDIRFSAIFDDKIQKGCGTGTSMCTYDVDGRALPCHMFMDINKKGLTAIPEIQKGNSYIDMRCTCCCYNKLCYTCYGMNFLENGDISIKSPQYCLMKKAELGAALWYKSKLLEQHLNQNGRLTNEEYWEAKALLKISQSSPETLA